MFTVCGCTCEGGQLWVHVRRRGVGDRPDPAGGRLGVDAWYSVAHRVLFSKIDQWSILLAYWKTRSTLLPLMLPLMSPLIRKNRLPARIRGWAGTATGGHIHVVHISHTHPPKELIQTQRIYLLGKMNRKIETI